MTDKISCTTCPFYTIKDNIIGHLSFEKGGFGSGTYENSSASMCFVNPSPVIINQNRIPCRHHPLNIITTPKDLDDPGRYDHIITVRQTTKRGQLLNKSGHLATWTNGSDEYDDFWHIATYIAGDDIPGIGHMRVFKSAIIERGVFKNAKTNSRVYLGSDGEYTLDDHHGSKVGVKQIVGFVTNNGQAMINLE